ncbi:MAG: hypothetical protein WCC12_13575 [Anaerolineales bacterium]
MRDQRTPASRAAVEGYETTTHIFGALFREIKELAKKKPDASMSAFKVAQVNRLLGDMKTFLKDAPEQKYLDLLDDEALPQVADALVVMAQYEGALKGFRERHYG